VETGRTALRWGLAAFMLTAGIGHFVATDSFLELVPGWLPQRRAIVLITGAMEIGFAPALLVLPGRRREVGWALSAFFVLVFPGNVHQAVGGIRTFGLETPAARWGRLPFQAVLVAWALWSTGAWPRRVAPGPPREA
jgi:uncharacterized membrane protein